MQSRTFLRGLFELPNPNNVIIKQRKLVQDIAEYWPNG